MFRKRALRKLDFAFLLLLLFMLGGFFLAYSYDLWTKSPREVQLDAFCEAIESGPTEESILKNFMQLRPEFVWCYEAGDLKKTTIADDENRLTALQGCLSLPGAAIQSNFLDLNALTPRCDRVYLEKHDGNALRCKIEHHLRTCGS